MLNSFIPTGKLQPGRIGFGSDPMVLGRRKSFMDFSWVLIFV
jgi:hypothetical protein